MNRVSQVVALGIVCALTFVFSPAAAPGAASTSVTGALTQLASPNDCVEEGGTECGTTAVGIKGIQAVAVSPDGKNVYTTEFAGSAIAEFSRDATTGALTQLTGSNSCIGPSPECPAQATGLDEIEALAVSPDGKNVYVVSSGGAGEIAEFTRNADGSLTQLTSPNDCIVETGGSGCGTTTGHGLINAYDVTVSPDGKNVYVASGGNGTDQGEIAEFSRDTTTGALTQLTGANDCIEEHGSGTDCGTTTGEGLLAANKVVVSPDGKNVYTGEDNDPGAIAEFTRNSDGSLTQLAAPNACLGETGNTDCTTTGHGLSDIYGLVVSPDGANVYSSSLGPHGPIAELVRNSDGSLGQLASPNDCLAGSGDTECGTTTGHPLDSVYGLAISPDGDSLYAASDEDNALLELARNSDGSLAQLAAPNDCIQETGGSACGSTATGLTDPLGVAVSPDGTSVYVAASSTAGDVAEFSRAGSAPTSVTVTRFDDPAGSGNCPTDCSLRQAIAYVAAGGTVNLPAGAYQLSQGELLDGAGVTISGAGARTTTIEQTAGARVLEIGAGASTTVQGVTITQGAAPAGGGTLDGYGGGILVDAGADLTLSDSTVIGNSADHVGGGIYGDSSARVTIEASLIRGDDAADGGGIGLRGTLTSTNSTVVGNQASQLGGGIYDDGTATFTNDTIVGNTSPPEESGVSGGANVFVNDTSYGGFQNTIVALPQGGGSNCYTSGVFPASGGHNLEDDAAQSCYFTDPTDKSGVDPGLGGVQDNGGPTDTLLPDASSPTIDAGSDSACPATDQRGVTRPQGAHCDIGAVEVVPSSGGSSLAATTGAASDVLRDSATVHGLVDPGGSDATAYFEYGTDTTYGSRTPAQDAGSVDGYVAAAQLNGLTPHTTYHYRLVATEGTTTVDGADHEFTTLGPPLVTTGDATGVTGTSATLSGTINPQTSDTHYHFEYGTTPAYGTSAPAGSETDLGAGDQTNHAVSVALPAGTLQPSTTYHYRLVADNQDGTTDGADQTFTTLAAPPVVDSESATVGSETVTLHALIDTHGLGGTYHFEWRTDCSFALQCGSAPHQSGSTPDVQLRPSSEAGLVTLDAAITPWQGQTIDYHVVGTTSAGDLSDPGQSVAFAGPSPTAATGATATSGTGRLSLTGQVSPEGYPVGYHFHLSLAGGCTNNAQASLDTPEQTIAGGDYGQVPVSATVTAPPGATLSEQLVVDWVAEQDSGADESAASPTATVRVPGASTAGDIVDPGDLKTTSADIGVFLGPRSTLAQSTPQVSSGSLFDPISYGPPLMVQVDWGTSTGYGASASATWTDGGAQPVCPFSAQFPLTGLTPGTTYHVRVESGFTQCYGQYIGCDWNQIAAEPDVTFTTPSGDSSGGLVLTGSAGKAVQMILCATKLPCTGTSTYSYTAAARKTSSFSGPARTRPRMIVVGSARFRLAGHSRRQIAVHLSKAGRRLVRSRQETTLVEVLRIRSGRGHTVTTRRLVRVRVAQGWRHRR